MPELCSVVPRTHTFLPMGSVRAESMETLGNATRTATGTVSPAMSVNGAVPPRTTSESPRMSGDSSTWYWPMPSGTVWTKPIESVVNEELLTPNTALLRDDELLVLQGKVQPDRFSGGVRFNVQQIWDLPSARARFGKYLAIAVNDHVPPIAQLLTEFPARQVSTEHGDLVQGLPVRLQLQREAAYGELDLGDEARFWPSDAALARWRESAQGGAAQVVYG